MGEEISSSLAKAKAFVQGGKYEDALALCLRVIESHPNSYETYELRSSIHRKMNNFEASIQDLDRVISLVPDSAAPHFRKGRYLAQMSRYSDAVQEFTRALELDRGYFGETLFFHRAEALLRSGDYDGALRDCQHVDLDHVEQHFYGYKQRCRADIEHEAKARLVPR